MAQEDLVQQETVGYWDYSIAATVLTVNLQRGRGALTRTGVGTLSITLPAGSAQQNSKTEIRFTSKESTGTFAVAVLDTTSTDTVKKVVILDAAGAAVDNIDGAITLVRTY